MIAAGSLNRRLTIYAPDETSSPTGTVTAGWRKEAEVWAAQDSLNLRDASRMAGRTEAAEARFTIRYVSGVTTAHQVSCKGRRYTVVEVEELGREGLKLLVRAI